MDHQYHGYDSIAGGGGIPIEEYASRLATGGSAASRAASGRGTSELLRAASGLSRASSIRSLGLGGPIPAAYRRRGSPRRADLAARMAAMRLASAGSAASGARELTPVTDYDYGMPAAGAPDRELRVKYTPLDIGGMRIGKRQAEELRAMGFSVRDGKLALPEIVEEPAFERSAAGRKEPYPLYTEERQRKEAAAAGRRRGRPRDLKRYTKTSIGYFDLQDVRTQAAAAGIPIAKSGVLNETALYIALVLGGRMPQLKLDKYLSSEELATAMNTRSLTPPPPFTRPVLTGKMGTKDGKPREYTQSAYRYAYLQDIAKAVGISEEKFRGRYKRPTLGQLVKMIKDRKPGLFQYQAKINPGFDALLAKIPPYNDSKPTKSASPKRRTMAALGPALRRSPRRA